MTTLFCLLAAALAGGGLTLLVRPLVRAAPPSHPDRRAVALAVHRERLAEIEAEAEAAADPRGPAREGGDDTGRREARVDAARALLQDLEADAPPGGSGPLPDQAGPPPHRAAAVVLGVAFPLLAAGLYAWLGEPRALAPAAVRPPPLTADATGAEVERLIAQAEAIARANGNRLDGEPIRLLERALALRPDHRKALWLGAVAALHEDRPADARERLERVRALGPLDEGETRIFDRLMAQARARATATEP